MLFRLCLLLCLSVATFSFPESIFDFHIQQTKQSVLLQYSSLDNVSLYEKAKTNLNPSIIILTKRPEIDFKLLKEVEKESVHKLNYVYDARDYWKVPTRQLHVVIPSTNSVTMPGTIKMMIPLKNMNSTDIANFIRVAMEVERQVISPNIDKVLCSSTQNVVLMNTLLGKFKCFSMYIAGLDSNVTEQFNDTGAFDMNPEIARDLLNPLPCKLLFGPFLNRFKFL